MATTAHEPSRGEGRRNLVLVLYRVANVDPVGDASSLYGFNAFEIPRGPSVTLATVKRHCTALQSVNVLGTEGYHWRVRVEEDDDAPTSFLDVARRVRRTWGSRKWSARYSWWDVLDEQSPLPMIDVHLSDVGRLFQSEGSTPDEQEATHRGPLLSVVAFKLLDMLQMERSCRCCNSPRLSSKVARRRSERLSRGPPLTLLRDEPPLVKSSPSMDQLLGYFDSESDDSVASRHEQEKPPAVVDGPVHMFGSKSPPIADLLGERPEADLLGISRGEADLLGAAFGVLDPSPSPVADPFGASQGNFPDNTTPSAVMEPPSNVDLAGVSDDVSSMGGSGAEQSPPNRASCSQFKTDLDILDLDGTPAPPAKWEKDVFADTADDLLDFTRPTEIRPRGSNENSSVIDSTGDELSRAEDAINEHRARMAEKQTAAAEEARVALELEPRVKAWSHDGYGGRKQLRVLLSSLQDILWEDADWKPVSIGDILDARNCKRAYHKASRVVHPDRTLQLGAGERFLSKRIFDALAQAKTHEDELQ